jgi:hypothetical protein
MFIFIFGEMGEQTGLENGVSGNRRKMPPGSRSLDAIGSLRSSSMSLLLRIWCKTHQSRNLFLKKPSFLVILLVGLILGSVPLRCKKFKIQNSNLKNQ